jgi:hypothetical protein
MEPRTIVKSRAVLQSLKNWELSKYKTYDRLLSYIWNYVSNKALNGETQFVYSIPDYEIQYCNFVGDEFVEIVKKEYVDCDISYVETRGVNYVTRALTIDWS